MISRRKACRLLPAGVLAATAAAAQDAAAINRELASRPQLTPTAHPDAQWFPQAGLGLFIHWGLASVHGGIDLSWGMMHGMGKGLKITPEEYFRLAERFQPDKWDPDRMLSAAKAAGFRYAVLTAKHHEGFALWPSRFGDFNTRKHAGGVDLVRPFIEACRKNGLKAGLYYSPGDWYFSREFMSFHYRSAHCWQTTGLTCKPELPDFDTRFQPVQLPARTAEFDRAYREYKRGQITELLTRYGKLDLLWFDMADVVMTPEEIRSLQPGIVINNRMGSGTGDFLTPEGEFPQQRPAGWWELCTIWNSPNWGYVRSNEERYRPLGDVLHVLSKARAWGGNLLLNVGPRGDGGMPRPYYDGTAEMAAWMKHSGAAVHDVQPGAAVEAFDVPVTMRGDTRFLHLPPNGSLEVVQGRVARRPAVATLLRTGEPVAFDFTDGLVRVRPAPAQRTGLADVIALQLS